MVLEAGGGEGLPLGRGGDERGGGATKGRREVAALGEVDAALRNNALPQFLKVE